jgi:hypothetical protein
MRGAFFITISDQIGQASEDRAAWGTGPPAHELEHFDPD